MPAEKIRLLLFDVDGVLTDGRITYTDGGDEIKAFSVLDEAGCKYLVRAGLAWGMISGRESAAARRRGEETGAGQIRLGAKRKLVALEEILRESGRSLDEVGYVGDDLTDLPVLRAVGFSACPADARAEVRAEVEYVAAAAGGRGVAREVIEHVLGAQGKWQDVLAFYEKQRPGGAQ